MTDTTDLASATIAELRATAAEHGIDLSGLSLKAEILAAVSAGISAETSTETEAAASETPIADAVAADIADTQTDTTTETETTEAAAPDTTLGDYGASVLRTAVPSVWGTILAGLLAWLLPLLPGDVGDALSSLLSSEAVTGVLVAASIAAWYAVARKIEPKLPVWLTRLVLGYAASPSYAR